MDIFHLLGHLLLFGWWLFAAGLVVGLVLAFRRRRAVWGLMWLPLPLVLWVALPPLQQLHQSLTELQHFYEQCRYYEPPSQAFLAYKQRQWEHAAPYIAMLAATGLLYAGATTYLVKFQRNKPAP